MNYEEIYQESLKKASKVSTMFMWMCMEMWACDVEISYDFFKADIDRRIKNFESSIGEEAHKRLEAMGVNDLTGQTWEEQDAYALKRIEEYKELLSYLEDDKNWAW